MKISWEQHAAAERLRALPGRFKVTTDVEGWPIIAGRYGRIEYHDGETLAVFTDRRRTIPKLQALPGVRRHQTGDDEARMLFEPEALPMVARLIGAKRRRTSSPLQLAELAAGRQELSRKGSVALENEHEEAPFLDAETRGNTGTHAPALAPVVGESAA